MMRFPVLLLAAVSVLVACGGGSPAPPSPTSVGPDAGSATGYRVFVHSPDSVRRLASTSDAASKLPLGVLATSGKQLYAVYASVASDLRSFDTATGALTAELKLPAYYSEIAGQSLSGGYLVLTGAENGATRFASVPSGLQGTVHSALLTNNFSFDALSNDGRWLYLIEHFTNGLDYHVRRYDLVEGRLDPNILVEKGASTTALMNGERYASVADYSTVYSLYYGKSGAFVHALALDGGPIRCFDLPGPRALDPQRQRQWALAFGPGRDALFAVNAAEGQVSRINLNSGQISSGTFSPPTAEGSWWSPVTTAQAKEFDQGTGSAAVSPDGKTLFASSLYGYVAIDATTLKLRGAYLTGSLVDSLAVTPDGRWLLAVQDLNQLVRIDPARGRVDHVLLSARGPLSVLRVDAVS